MQLASELEMHSYDTNDTLFLLTYLMKRYELELSKILSWDSSPSFYLSQEQTLSQNFHAPVLQKKKAGIYSIQL